MDLDEDGAAAPTEVLFLDAAIALAAWVPQVSAKYWRPVGAARSP
ncbi:hypothetical protein N8J89_21635 [Crossiella sp. CA-258035]|nr:hypothetical protein [Crossiella sp. CA-258035]WHT15743.1 hypothetical protein N8J89_21635 [Crossiella sp. CA-258035]